MNKFIFFAIFYLNWCANYFVLCDAEEDNSDILVSVAVLFRHGDRAPKTSFPNDLYYNKTYWPMGFSQLTNKGKQRHYALGKWFRSRYDSFLPAEYSSDDIYIRSSDVDRTLMSAAANLAGLYPPTSAQVWNADIPWQPIPIHTIAKKEDLVISMKKKCKKYKKLLKKVDKTKFFVKINEEYATLFEYLSNQTGWEVDDISFVKDLQSIFSTYKSYNSSFLPSWADSLDQDEINYLAGLAFTKATYTKDLQRLRIGPFWDYLLSYFDDVVNNVEDTAKFLMLSGHESTIAAVLDSVGAFDLLPPDFASAVIWELRQNEEGYYVTMFYKNDSGVAEVSAAGCDSSCNLEDFKNILDSIRVTDSKWDTECDS